MIEGYPETVTVGPGDTVTLCVSTDHPRFRVDFYRQGVNLFLIGSNEWQDGSAFARGTPDQDWGWGRYEFTIPTIGFRGFTSPCSLNWMRRVT
jgi:hypothetical protein